MPRCDLHVRHVPSPLLAPAPPIVERVFFSRVGHTFGPAPVHPHEPAAYLVQDFLLDQSNISGADGEMTYNYFLLGTNTNHFVQFFIEADVPDAISFTGVMLTGVYPPRGFDPGLKSYGLFTTSIPFNIQGTDVPYLMFSYRTPGPVDPGPFVFLG